MNDYIKIEDNYGFHIIPLAKINWVRYIKAKQTYEINVSVGMGSKDFEASEEEVMNSSIPV